MANEIQLVHDDAAETVYAIVRETAATGRWYDNTTHQALETFDDANWATYKISLSLVHAGLTSGNAAYQGTFPALAAGFYWLDVYIQAGANPAQTDFRVASNLMYWNGTALVPAGGAADVRQVAGNGYAIAATTGNWDTAGTWAGGVVPVAGDNIIIRNGVAVLVADNLDLGQFGELKLQGTGALNIDVGVTVTTTPADWVVLGNNGTVTYNFGTVAANNGTITNNYGTVTYNYGTVTVNAGTVTYNNSTLITNNGTVTNNYGMVTNNYNTVTDNSGAVTYNYGTVTYNYGTVTNNYGMVSYAQSGDSFPGVRAIATILSGITSLANWLRGLYRKDAINSAALGEINAIHDGGAAGTFSATTDSAEAVRTVVDAIKVKTDTIGSGRVTYASTVAEAALATIWAGDDYRAADGTQFSITVDDYAGPSLATATGALRIMDSVQYLSEVAGASVEADLKVAATISIDGDTITLAADLTAAQTAALDTCPPAAPRNYIYEFVCTLANTHVGYRTHGQMTVKKAIS